MEKIVSRVMSWIAVMATIALLTLLPASMTRAEDAHDQLDAIIKQYLVAHPEEVGEIVKEYVIKHPDVFRDVLVDLTKAHPGATGAADADSQAKPATINPTAAVESNAGKLFRSAHQVTLGNPDGDVTMVEFFDYNCGFCKGALPAMLTLLDDDPKLKIVLKEWPILGPGSVDAAHVAIAARMQDADGQKYLAFHRKLLGDPGPADKEKALAAAAAAGLDIPRLEKDMASDEVRATIDENFELARAIGINGTPGYVIGDTVVPGAVGLPGLQSQVATARAHLN